MRPTSTESCGGQVYIHQLDAAHPLAQQFPVGNAFSGDFERGSLEAYHIGGHTPGFTMYIHGDVLLSGRALARAPLGGGFPASSFRFARWVHTSTLEPDSKLVQCWQDLASRRVVSRIWAMLIHASLEAMDFSQSFASQGICDSVQLRNRTESQSLETAQLFSGQALRA